MAIKTPPKSKPLGTFSPKRKRDRERQVARREEKAEERLTVATFAATQHDKGTSWRDIADIIESWAITGKLSRPYSHEALRYLAEKFQSGKKSSDDYLDTPRSGRPNRIAGILMEKIQTAVLTAEDRPVSLLYFNLSQFADGLGIPMPSYDTVKRCVAKLGHTAQVAATFGAKAAQVEGMTHGSVPAQFPHDVWVLDEFDAPFYSRVYDKKLAEWVSVRATVVTVVDHRTGVVVGYWLVDPSRRTDKETGYVMRAGFEADDVMAALLTAAWGQRLATPATADFTGWMPRCLRWDNHKTHGKLRDILEKLGERLHLEVASFYPASEDVPMTSFADWHEVDVEGVSYSDSRDGVIVPKLPIMRAINRGKIERSIGIVKGWCRHLDSHVDRVIPLDRLDTSPKWQRDVSAGSGKREYRRIPTDVMRLPDINESRAILDTLIHRFNHVAVPRRTGMTRKAHFRRDWQPKTVRPGGDLLAAIDPKVGFVSPQGIEHHHDGKSTLFSYQVDGRFALMLDTEVIYKADPLQRCIWVNIDGRWYWVPPKFEWASEPGRAEEVARHSTARSRYHAGEGIAARGAQKDERHGPGATAEDEKAADDILKGKRKAPRADTDAEPVVDEAPAATPPSGAHEPTSSTSPKPVFRSRADRLRDDTGHSPLDAVG